MHEIFKHKMASNFSLVANKIISGISLIEAKGLCFDVLAINIENLYLFTLYNINCRILLSIV